MAHWEALAALVCSGLPRACVQGTVFILAVWLLCRFVPRVPASVRCALWWLASLKLITGLAWAGFAVPILPNTAAARISQPITLPGPVARIIPTAYKYAVTPSPAFKPTHSQPVSQTLVISHATTAERARQLPSIRCLLAIAWLIGIAGMALLNIARFMALQRVLRRARLCDSKTLLADFADLCRRMKLRRAPRLVQSDKFPTPCIVGAFRPVIVLPEQFVRDASPAEQRMALAHELAHWRRGDLWLAAVPSLAHTLFVFFPPAWWAMNEYNAAREEACDALTLHITGARPKAYAQLLLRLMPAGNGSQFRMAAAGMASAYPELKRRIAGLSETTHGQNLKFAAVIILIAALALVAPWRLTPAHSRTPQHTPPTVAVPEYTITLIGDDNAAAYASGINSHGQVVGVWTTGNGKYYTAMIWNGGQNAPLSHLPHYRSSTAFGINNSGKVIASSFNYERYHHAYIEDGQSKPISALAGYPFSHGQAINDLGQVAGYAEAARTKTWTGRDARAYLWDGGTTRDLGTLGGAKSYAYGVNNQAQVVGKAELPREAAARGSFAPAHAFLWQSDIMSDLGVLPGGLNSIAYRVNDLGQVIGCSETSAGRHAFLWQGNAMTDLGTLPGTDNSTARGINNRGQIVGQAVTSDEKTKRAVLWQNGQIADINNFLPKNSGWELNEARDINDQGQIVGWGRCHGRIRAFLLTPVKGTQA